MGVLNMTVFVLLVVVVMMMVEAVGSAEVKDKEEECCEPRHVHLALGEAADLVHVMWDTRSPCRVTKVMYGTSPWQLQFQVTGKSVNLTGPPSGGGGVRYLHKAILMGLQEGKTYFYRPICNRIGSGPFYFKSPYAHTNWAPQVLVTGELGAGTQLLPLLSQRTLSGQFSATLELGGLSAYLADDNGTREDQVLQSLQQTAAFLPLMTSPGDDERGDDSQLRLYSHVFAMPGSPWPPPHHSYYYSFDLGPVHFVSVGTGVYVHGSPQDQNLQQQWLRADLMAANKARNSRPWIVVFTHHPLYCSPRQQDIHCAHSRAIQAAGLEDLLYSQGVDLILQSHRQGYQRFYPLYKGLVLTSNYTQPPAPVHIVLGSASSTVFPTPPAPTTTTTTLEKSTESGVTANITGDGQSSGGGGDGGGSSNSSSSSSRSSSSDGGSNVDVEDIVAFEMLNGTELTYGRLLVLNATHAYWELLSGEAGKEGEILDKMWLVQDHHGPFHLKDLPQEVEDKIQQHSSTSGQGKPDVLNSQGGGSGGSNPNSHDHSSNHPLGDVLSAVSSHRGLALGLSLGAVSLMLALMVLACRLRRRRPQRRRGMVTRRWDSVDYKYGKTKLSNDVDDDYDYEDEDDEFKDGNDEGNGMGDGLQTKRLITTRH